MNWYSTVVIGLLFLGTVGGFIYLARTLRAQVAQVKPAEDTSKGLPMDLIAQLAPEIATRLAAVERRMETLEQDALTYLRKGSQRAEQARRREARLESQEMEPEEEVDDEAREQLERALEAPEPAEGDGYPSLEDIRARIGRGGA